MSAHRPDTGSFGPSSFAVSDYRKAIARPLPQFIGVIQLFGATLANWLREVRITLWALTEVRKRHALHDAFVNGLPESHCTRRCWDKIAILGICRWGHVHYLGWDSLNRLSQVIATMRRVRP